MSNLVAHKRCSVVFAAVLIAMCVLASPRTVMAQEAGAVSSPQTQDIMQNVYPVFFPYDIYSRVVDPSVLQTNANFLRQHPDSPLWLQGYADIRGDIFYNLVLSYRRAQYVKSQLVKNGVSESQIGFATGWGKLYPVCQGDDEACYQKQRRVDIVPPDHM